jgi:hypothetical protein
MRIAFTGTSSTGKTTTAHHLMDTSVFREHADRLIPSVSREIIGYFGFPSVSQMTRQQSQVFEILHFSRKLWQEHPHDRFITDRSFVDVAAIWIERDTRGMSKDIQDLLVKPCRALSARYDFHCYFPRGVIPFERDSARSVDHDYHQRVDARIRFLLDAWDLPYITMTESDISKRTSKIIGEADRVALEGVRRKDSID